VQTPRSVHMKICCTMKVSTCLSYAGRLVLRNLICKGCEGEIGVICEEQTHDSEHRPHEKWDLSLAYIIAYILQQGQQQQGQQEGHHQEEHHQEEHHQEGHHQEGHHQEVFEITLKLLPFGSHNYRAPSSS
jgi:hypothetical protein